MRSVKTKITPAMITALWSVRRNGDLMAVSPNMKRRLRDYLRPPPADDRSATDWHLNEAGEAALAAEMSSPACDYRGCINSVTEACVCSRCASRPEKTRYHTCGDHRKQVALKHHRVFKVAAVWPTSVAGAGANGEVSLAIHKAYIAIDDAVTAWERVAAAEQALARLPTLPEAERAIGSRGVGSARVTIAVLRSLGRKHDDG